MKQITQILTILVAMILLFPSCTENIVYPTAMQQAVACMDSRPDSAQLYLSSLTDSALTAESEEVRMYHALLCIKAADKLYQTHTSDSLIQSIVRYYEEHPNRDKLMEAYFYLGSTYRDMNDAPRALKAYQQVLDAGEESSNYTLLGNTYGQMGTLYAYQGLYEEALEAKKKTLKYYQKKNETKRIPLAHRDIARMYGGLNKKDSTLHYYNNAYQFAREIKDERISNNILGELGCFYYSIGMTDSAKIILLQAIEQRKQASNILFHLGLTYKKLGNADSAQKYFHKVIRNNDIHITRYAHRCLSILEAEKKDYSSAIHNAKQSWLLSDSIDKITQVEAVKRIQSLYNYQHTENKNYQLAIKNEKYRHSLHVLVLSIIIVIALSSYTVYVIRKNRQEAIHRERRLRLLKEEQYARSLHYIEENNQKLEILEKKLQTAEANTDMLNKQFLLLQKETLEQSNRQTVMERDKRELLEKAFRQSRIYRHFHKADVRITDADWKELQEAIDTAYPFFTDRLYNLYPKLSLQELRICYLIRLSLSYTDMANILGRTSSAITKARTRLYAKIYGEGRGEGNIDKIILDL